MLLAQTPGAATGDLASIATLVTQIGLSAIFLWLWWTERKERQESQLANRQILERTLSALFESTDALDRVQAALNGLLERNSPDNRAADLAIRRLELLTDELGSTLRQTRRRREEFDDGPV